MKFFKALLSVIGVYLALPNPALAQSPCDIVTCGDQVIDAGQSVQLWASGADYYQWSPTQGLSDPNIPNPIASPTVTTTYTVTGFGTGQNLVVNGDFEQGNTGFTSAYSYNNNLYSEGTYYVGYNSQSYHPDFQGTAYAGSNFMIINGSTSANTNVWTQVISVSPNTYYAFSTWVCTVSPAGDVAMLQFAINGSQLGNVFTAPSSMNTWRNFYEIWYSGSSTSATITILNQNIGGSGNDFGLDDISFTTLYECTATVTVTIAEPISISPVAAPPAICEGNSFALTVPQVTGGHGSWTGAWEIGPSANGPFTPLNNNNIPSSYNGYYIRYVVTENGNTYCSNAVPVSVISMPTAIIVSDAESICAGETTTLQAIAEAGGGTPTYQWNTGATTPTISVSPSQTTTYSVIVSAGVNCEVTATYTVTVNALPTANFNATTVCVGEATQFTSTSTGQGINSYQWNFGDNQTGTGQNATHTYAQAGTYQVTLAVEAAGGCSDQVTRTVTVNPLPTSNFTATNVCQGNPTQFTSTASGGQINTYQWNFGDGQTGNGQTVSHSYAQPGTYNVTHTVQTAGGCSDQVTQTVDVYAMPVASASATPSTILYGANTTLTADPGTQGTFNFHWEPANMVVNPNAQTTQTVALQESQTFTVTITNPQGGCTSTAQVIVSIDGSSLLAMATADQTDLCDGESTTLHAIPSGGAPENYTYQWSPAGSLNSTSSQNPVATPSLGNTTYTCHVSDGFTDINVSVTIHVHPNVERDIYQTICENDTYSYFGEDIHTPGVYDHTLHTQYGCDSIVHLHLDNWQTFETTVSDRFCQNDTYHFYGQDITSPGVYTHTLLSVHDCDSTIRLNLSQDPVYEFEMWESTCEGGPGFYYEGSYLQPNTVPYSFPYETVNHCDSTIILHIDEAEYNTKNYNVSLCGTEYTWVSNGVTYYETGVYRDTLHFDNTCDSVVVLNLEIRPNYHDDVVVSSCDDYRWLNDNFNVDMTFTESTVYTHHYINAYGCESEATLHLTINDHDEYAFVVPEDEACDQYFWDPQGHDISYTDHDGDLYTMTGVYHRTYLNQADCDSLVTMRVDMEYTPHPTPIYPMDLDNTAPHWVVTATEFQINAYDFNLWDTNPLCRWDTVTWQCVGAPDWIIEPFGAKAKCCKVYVLNRVEDTVWLTAHAFNRCAPDEGVMQKYWMVCSFYGVDENAANTDFSVVPNPNNGQMTLNFENLTGKIKVKVYDMKGALLDNFETYNAMDSYAYTYQMRNRVDGIYFFVATGKEGTVAKKVIIKR